MNSQKTKQFCHNLLALSEHRSRAAANYIISLALNDVRGRHPVDLTDSSFNSYTYSNLTKVVKYWDISGEKFRKLILDYFPPPRKLSNGEGYYGMSFDFTKLQKPHSECLAGREYVVKNNPGGSVVEVCGGYTVSALHLDTGQSDFVPPLSMELLTVLEDKNDAAIKYIGEVLSSPDLPLGKDWVILRADSGFSKAKFLAPLLEANKKLGIIVRFRHGIKVATQYNGLQKKSGCPRIYGQTYYLMEESREIETLTKKGEIKQKTQIAITELQPDEVQKYPQTLGNGRNVIVETTRWNNLMIRSRQKSNMKDKPFDLVRVLVFDAQTQKRIFNKGLYLGTFSKVKDEITAPEIQTQYRQRYKVESAYRFQNQSLMFNQFQSPVLEYQQKWTQIVMLAYWLLYVASHEIEHITVKPWQKYLLKNKPFFYKDGKYTDSTQPQPISLKTDAHPTIAQTQKALPLLFRTFDKTPFLPQKSKKGKGRHKGTIIPKKIPYPVTKKRKKDKKQQPKTQQE